MYLPSQSLTAGLQTLQTLILSYHPVIVIETVEEERVQNLLQAVTQEMGLTLMEWSATRGLARSHGQSTGQTENRWHNEYAPPGSQAPAAHEGTTEPDQLLTQMQCLCSKTSASTSTTPQFGGSFGR
jgi:hypothetical protein